MSTRAATRTRRAAQRLVPNVWSLPLPRDWAGWEAATGGLPTAPARDIPLACVGRIWQGWAIIGSARYFQPRLAEPQIAVCLRHPESGWAATSLPQSLRQVGGRDDSYWHHWTAEEQWNITLLAAEDATIAAVTSLPEFVDGLAGLARSETPQPSVDPWVLPENSTNTAKLAAFALHVLWRNHDHEEMRPVRTMAALGAFGDLPAPVNRA